MAYTSYATTRPTEKTQTSLAPKTGWLKLWELGKKLRYQVVIKLFVSSASVKAQCCEEKELANFYADDELLKSPPRDQQRPLSLESGDSGCSRLEKGLEALLIEEIDEDVWNRGRSVQPQLGDESKKKDAKASSCHFFAGPPTRQRELECDRKPLPRSPAPTPRLHGKPEQAPSMVENSSRGIQTMHQAHYDAGEGDQPQTYFCIFGVDMETHAVPNEPIRMEIRKWKRCNCWLLDDDVSRAFLLKSNMFFLMRSESTAFNIRRRLLQPLYNVPIQHYNRSILPRHQGRILDIRVLRHRLDIDALVHTHPYDGVGISVLSPGDLRRLDQLAHSLVQPLWDAATLFFGYPFLKKPDKLFRSVLTYTKPGGAVHVFVTWAWHQKLEKLMTRRWIKENHWERRLEMVASKLSSSCLWNFFAQHEILLQIC